MPAATPCNAAAPEPGASDHRSGRSVGSVHASPSHDPHGRRGHEHPGCDRLRLRDDRGGVGPHGRAQEGLGDHRRRGSSDRDPDRARPRGVQRHRRLAARHEGQRVDDPTRRHGHARPLGAGGVRRLRQASLPPPSGGGGRQAGRGRVPAVADGVRAGPARGAPVDHRGAARAGGRDRGGDVGGRRAGARGLLPLPPVQRGRAGRSAPARGRVVPPLRGAPAQCGRARGLRGRGGAAAPGAGRHRRPAPGSGRVEHDGHGGSSVGHVDGRRGRGLQADAGHHPCRAASQRTADVCGHADPDHGHPPASVGTAADRSPRGPRLRRQLPVDAHGRGVRRGPRSGRRAVPDHHDRPRVQRFDLHGPGHLLLGRGRGRRGGRWHGCPVRSPARRGAVPGARPARCHRHRRQRPALPGRRGHEGREDHGLRAPGLQDRRPPLDVPAGCGRAHRRREDRVRQEGRADGRRGAGRAQARPRPVRQRRVLRRRRDGPLRSAPRAVHPHVRVEPRHRLVRQHPRAGSRQPDHPPLGPLRRPPAAPAPARRG